MPGSKADRAPVCATAGADFPCLTERLPEDERRACAGRRQQRIENGPGAIGRARRLQHLPDTGILNLGDFQIDGGPGDRA
jgi:hypothetical protein